MDRAGFVHEYLTTKENPLTALISQSTHPQFCKAQIGYSAKRYCPTCAAKAYTIDLWRRARRFTGGELSPIEFHTLWTLTGDWNQYFYPDKEKLNPIRALLILTPHARSCTRQGEGGLGLWNECHVCSAESFYLEFVINLGRLLNEEVSEERSGPACHFEPVFTKREYDELRSKFRHAEDRLERWKLLVFVVGLWLLLYLVTKVC